jgi:hypothetical protein
VDNQPEGYLVHPTSVGQPVAKRSLFSPRGGTSSTFDQARKVKELLRERAVSTNKPPSSINLEGSDRHSIEDSQVTAAERKAKEEEELRKWKEIQAESLLRIQKACEVVELITWCEQQRKSEEESRLLNKRTCISEVAIPHSSSSQGTAEPSAPDSNQVESGTPNWAEVGARAWAEAEEHSRAAEGFQAKAVKAAVATGRMELEERNKAEAEHHDKAAADCREQAVKASAKAAAKAKVKADTEDRSRQVVHKTLQGIPEESKECEEYIPDTVESKIDLCKRKPKELKNGGTPWYSFEQSTTKM